MNTKTIGLLTLLIPFILFAKDSVEKIALSRIKILEQIQSALDSPGACRSSNGRSEGNGMASACKELKDLYTLERVGYKYLHSIPRDQKPDEWREIKVLLSQLKEEYNPIAKACLDERFNRCFPSLNPSISKPELSKLFNKWKKNPLLRNGTGGGSCAYRAENLAYLLAQKGYSARSLRIEAAPTLIALDRDPDDSLKGNYHDYHGYHTLVEIMVEEDGEQVPYLLDPQFMTAPVQREQYFIKTIGQVCEENKIEKYEVHSALKCYFHVTPQSGTSRSSYSLGIIFSDDKPAVKCGWSNPLLNSDLEGDPGRSEFLKLLGGGTPEEFLRIKATEESSKELILYAYKQLENKIRQELHSILEEVKRLKLSFSPSLDWEVQRLEYLKKLKVQREQDLERVQEKFLEVQKNLAK